MKRSHRRWHRRAWLLLPALLAVLLLAAWWDRRAPPAAPDLPAVFVNVLTKDG
jgi:hypothetical protein